MRATIPSPTGKSRRRSCGAALVSAAAVLAAVAGGAVASAATTPVADQAQPAHLAAAGTAHGLANPSVSIAPTAAFTEYCYTPGYTKQCNDAAVASMDIGRKAEGLGPVRMQSYYWGMTTVQQLTFLVNKERRVRDLVPMAASPTLDSAAQAGAQAGDDPDGPADYAWGSNIAWGYQTPLAAVFGWMYDDGPDSPNTACTSAGAPACWGHRDNILARWRGDQGAGVYDNRGVLQLTQLFVAGY